VEGLDWDRALAIAEHEGLAPALGFVVKAEAPAAMIPLKGPALAAMLLSPARIALPWRATIE
jgi:hypothetical protein